VASSDRAKLEKYFKKGSIPKKITEPEIAPPYLALHSNKQYGNHNFTIAWVAITKPYLSEEKCHVHDFDQFLFFVGGDLTNMLKLGGEVELSLSLDGKKLEKFVFNEACAVYIPAGLYHCPLYFKKINDPKKPILFNNMFFTSKYKKAEVNTI
jgi:hypothetical protein